MPIEILTVPCLADNYAYILHDKLSNKTTLVDAPAFDPIKEQLEKQNWTLDNILLTHHHDDHIAGVAELIKHYNSRNSWQTRIPSNYSFITPKFR